MYINTITHKLAEVKDDCLVKDFLLAIYFKNPAYSTLQLNIQAFNLCFIHQIIEDYQ